MKNILYSFEREVRIKIMSSLIKYKDVIWNSCFSFMKAPIHLPSTTKGALKVLRFKKKELKFYNGIK